jgi:hypothetical protein
MWPAIDPFFVLVLALALAVTAASLVLVYEPWASHSTGSERPTLLGQVEPRVPAPPRDEASDEDACDTQP